MNNEEILAKQFLKELNIAKKENFNGIIRKLEDKQFKNINYDVFINECNKIGIKIIKANEIKTKNKNQKKSYETEWKNGKSIYIE